MTLSRVHGLVTNRADEDEIRGAIIPAMHDDLRAALAGARFENQPAPHTDLIIATGAVVRLIGQEWPRANKDEFIDGIAQEFQDEPGIMVLDALTRSRRVVTVGRMLASWIWTSIDPRVTALRHEIKILERLCELGGVDA